MKADFIEQAKQHKDYGKDKNSAFVGEHILSFTANDRKELDPEKLRGRNISKWQALIKPNIRVRNLLHLEEMCEAKKIPFSKDELQKTVDFNDKTYQGADLKAVFLLNRNETTLPTEKLSPENKEKQTEISSKPKQVQEEKSEDL